VTPRVGKPVEVQALWLNALALASDRSARWRRLFERGRESFGRRFWNEAGGCLYDVVDCDGRPGAVDASFRPNQTFAVGGLPVALLEGERARRVVDHVERKLWTPLGLRSLAPDESGYTPRYTGGPSQRDSAYHQGTVWPWLAGPFVEAWVRVRGITPAAKREARHRFVEPLMRHLQDAGLNHVSEIADAEAPHMPRGCPFQVWSVAELLRLDALLSEPVVKPLEASLHPMCG
jgi:glycogen debranching enzyme